MKSDFYKLEIPGFSSIRIKDESSNPTGTHKDRMAKKIGETINNFSNKQFSIISSGSSALALQLIFKEHNLPNLKVLLHNHIDKDIEDTLSEAGCIIYKHDLSQKSLSSENILSITQNEEGVDLTAHTYLEPFYSDIGKEIPILPDNVFVPFGTGQLYSSIKSYYRDNKNTCIFGATTKNPQSKATKLFSFFSPFLPSNLDNNIHVVEEEYLLEALNIAHNNNIISEYSGIAGLALFLQMKDTIPKDSTIVIINTGKMKLYPSRTE